MIVVSSAVLLLGLLLNALGRIEIGEDGVERDVACLPELSRSRVGSW